MPSPSTFHYTPDDVLRWLDRRTLEKGIDYVTEVYDLDSDSGLLSALVQGTARAPYRVHVDLASSMRSARSRLDAQCSCPVGQRCKHIAAVLFVALQQQARASDVDITSASTPQPRRQLLNQLSRWQAARAQTALSEPQAAAAILAYVLSVKDRQLTITVHPFRIKANGQPGFGSRLSLNPYSLISPRHSFPAEDLGYLFQLGAFTQSFGGARGALAPLLENIIASGRAWLASGMPVKRIAALAGSPRSAELGWQEQSTADGRQSMLAPVLQIPAGGSLALLDDAMWYVDEVSGEIGPLQLPAGSADTRAFLELPPLLAHERALTAQMLAQLNPVLPQPPGEHAVPSAPGTLPPQPVLTLDSFPVWQQLPNDNTPTHWLDLATVSFRYGDHEVPQDIEVAFGQDAAGNVHVLPRDFAKEAEWLRQLSAHGLDHLRQYPYQDLPYPPPYLGPRKSDWAWLATQGAASLREAGWQVVMAPEFRHQLTALNDIPLELIDTANGWFDLAMDIDVEGERVALAPLLSQLLTKDPRWTRGDLAAIADDEIITLPLRPNHAVRVQADRLKPLIALLGDLFGGKQTHLRLSHRDLGRLQALHDTNRLQFKADADTKAMVQRLLEGPGLRATQPPAGLQATLRDYQQQGLAWLQYLRAHDLAGVLADDMGLGKTLQTLAHILKEKEAGRLDRPALVVMPTTLLHNWQSEAARFTPTLRVLCLHGPQRQTLFEQIPQHDVVLTTYPLLWRDEAALCETSFHLLVLDEAQHVKNSKARAALALRHLDARHRLCLSGTPLENHLGELWAHFDFLLPGLLGTEKTFNQHWRHPIERGQDPLRARLLAQRLRPFILRRRKQDVASELPPKTLITRSVSLEGAQRDLYETVRTAMEKKVRDAVASNGLAKSHIVVLDALLKLRQACCDPRLLPGPRSKAGSAKLDLLLDMLPEMIEEGRRILLFSQFTSMLELLAQALDARAISYVTLTGDTRDRATPVKQFNSGNVPLFLISLKAGGVGLNLTSADTVIHYDPWWNPAAENQATDRAHRIGQDKPVFVYKLIAAGSIEERIVALQEHKAQLAESILGAGGKTAPRFDAEDLDALLAPLPPAVPATPGHRRSGKHP